MTKQTYLEKLEKLLANVDSKEKEDAVAYVKEYFDEASDKDIDEIIKELGTPEEFANNIKSDEVFKQKITPPEFKPKEENTKSNNYTYTPPKKSNKVWWIVGIAAVAFVFMAVIFGAGLTYTRRVIEDVVDVDEIDNDSIFSDHQTFEETIVGNINTLDMDLSMSNLEIIRTNKKENVIKFINLKEDEFELLSDNGNVTIKEYNKRDNADAKVVVELSNPSFTKLTVKQDMGSVEVENMIIDTIDINVSMGEVDLENIKANDIKIKIDMGSVGVNILGNPDHYSYYLKNSMGDTEYNGRKIGEGSADERGGDPNALRHIEIENNMGDIGVNFHHGRN